MNPIFNKVIFILKGNKMKKQLNTAIAALFLTTVSMAANATTDDNWYGYIGMQNSEVDLNASDVGGVSLDDDGMHVGVGYKVNV